MGVLPFRPPPPATSELNPYGCLYSAISNAQKAPFVVKGAPHVLMLLLLLMPLLPRNSRLVSELVVRSLALHDRVTTARPVCLAAAYVPELLYATQSALVANPTACIPSDRTRRTAANVQ